MPTGAKKCGYKAVKNGSKMDAKCLQTAYQIALKSFKGGGNSSKMVPKLFQNGYNRVL